MVKTHLVESSKARGEESARTRAGTEREPTEEPMRRVAQRKGETSQEATEEEKTLETIILKDLRSDDKGVLKKALGELWANYFDVEDEKNITESLRSFFLVCGPVVVVQVMDEHTECEAIQNKGIDVLAFASSSDDERDLRTAVGRVNGIETILAAMKRFHENKELLTRGFGALRNLTLDEENATSLVPHENAARLVAKLSALPFLVERMKAFPNDALMVEHSCWMLEHLCHSEQLKKTIVEAKAVSFLAAAFENHKDNPDIQFASKNAMAQLIED
jgi:hypothetical protein